MSHVIGGKTTKFLRFEAFMSFVIGGKIGRFCGVLRDCSLQITLNVRCYWGGNACRISIASMRMSFVIGGEITCGKG